LSSPHSKLRKRHFPFQIVLTVLACAPPVAFIAASPSRIGEKVPDFALKTLDERTTRLSDLLTTNQISQSHGNRSKAQVILDEIKRRQRTEGLVFGWLSLLAPLDSDSP
jgi:hypothetical protein